jgi:hypothetical protein
LDFKGETTLRSCRKRRKSLLFVILILTSVFWMGTYMQPSKNQVALAATEAAANTNVILLGWDGVQRNHLFELLDRGQMPNLSSFIQNGVIVNVTVSDHPTDTKAGWTQILTGYKWWRTGVFDNAIWFNSIPVGYTIPERLENIYGKNNIATAFIKGKVNHMETVNGTNTAQIGTPWSIYTNEAIYSNLPSELDVVSSGTLDNGVYDSNNDRYADVVGPVAIQFLQNNSNNHFFAFFHFADPDHLGHLYGENSVEYENGIKTCDSWLGQILTTLNTFNIAKKTLIYITADHGFDEGLKTHYFAPYIFLATNDKNVTRNGDEVDVAPTVYYGLGLWNQSFTPSLDGFPLQISLPAGEEEKRQSTLADTAAIPTPNMSITEGESPHKTVTFSARDNNLAAVLLILDNRLKSNGPWSWTRAGEVAATGSYTLNTASLSAGLHTVKILAFDDHGAYNGGIEWYPAGGGTPAMNSIDFYVENPTSPSPTPISSSLPTPIPPSPTPTAYSPSPMLTLSPNPLPSQSESPIPPPVSSIPTASSVPPSSTQQPTPSPVLPEFPSWTILLLTTITSLLVATKFRKRKTLKDSPKTRNYFALIICRDVTNSSYPFCPFSECQPHV